MTHPLPLRAGGAWAPLLIASAALLAPKPGRTSWEEAAAFPVPALTAEQVLSEALELRDGDDILVHEAGGVTGGMLVALASLRQATVIATAGPSSAARVRELGARHVLDYHDGTVTFDLRLLDGIVSSTARTQLDGWGADVAVDLGPDDHG
jgi:NADPH:quinone reductase-like Zn-dependent oxidoreductase